MSVPVPVDLLRWSYSPDTRVFTVGPVECGSCSANRAPVLPGRRMLNPWKTCSFCHGTGTRGRGHCSKCKYWRDSYTRGSGTDDYLIGMVPDYSDPQDGGPCPTCHGLLLRDPYAMAYGNARVPVELRDRMAADIPVRISVQDATLSSAQMLCGVFNLSTDTHIIQAAQTVSDHGTTFNSLVESILNGTEGEYSQALEDFRAKVRAEVTGTFRSAVSIGHSLAEDYRSRDPRFLLADSVTVLVTRNGYVVALVWDRERVAAATGR